MATSGWLGEQTLNSWGSYNSRLTTNVFINTINRYSDHIDVGGVVYLFCKSSGAKTVWYDWAIDANVSGNGLGQIKERTYNNNILNRSWSRNFWIRINCSNSATSATFHAGFYDTNAGGRDKYWTIYFDRYATGPSGIRSSSTYTQYSTITSSCSGINWGQGYSSRKLTCVASYTYQGKTTNITLGTWTDGATSKSVTKSDFNFPADLNVTIKWTASTNIGSVSTTSQVKVKQTFPAPDLSNTTIFGESTQPYTIQINVSGINYNYNSSETKAALYFDYILDGISYSTLIASRNDGSTEFSLVYSSADEDEPWKKIPEDEYGTLRLVVDNGHRVSEKTSANVYCQPQYEAYVIESIPDEEKETSAAEGNPIQIVDADRAPFRSIEIFGETSQETYSGKNLFNMNNRYSQGTTQTLGGVTCKYGQDQSVELHGTIENGSNVEFSGGTLYQIALDSSKEYYLLFKVISGSFETNTSQTVQIAYEVRYNSGSSVHHISHVLNGNTQTFKMDLQDVEYITRIRIYHYQGGATFTNFKFQVAIYEGSSNENFEPYVGGIPSPNPNYPQNVNTVTGEQLVAIQGKNILKPNLRQTSQGCTISENNNGSIHVEGTAVSDWVDLSNYSFEPKILKNTQYTFSLNNPIEYRTTLRIRYSDNTTTNYAILPEAKYVTFKTKDIDCINSYLYISGMVSGDNVDVLVEPQLELGSEATQYERYSEQKSCILSLSKNLINIAEFDIGGMNNGTSNPGMKYRINNADNPIPVFPNTTYTLSAQLSESVKGYRIGIHECRFDKSFIIDNGWKQLASNPYTFTTRSDTCYIKLVCSLSTTSSNVSTGGTENTTNFDDVHSFQRDCTIQLENGNSFTSYSPYEDNLRLTKIGSSIDKIYKNSNDKWVIKYANRYLHRTINSMDNSDNYPGWKNQRIIVSDLGTGLNTRLHSVTDFVSNVYKQGDSTLGNFSVNTSGNGALFITYSNMTQTQWKEDYKDLEVDLIYKILEEPEEVIITDERLVSQLNELNSIVLYKGINNIMLVPSSEETGELKVEYYAKYQDIAEAELLSNGKNGTGNFKEIRRIGKK